MTDVRVPTLGESVTEATVATWFKQPGDSINMDEMLCELETDKVTVEVPSPAAGVMGSIIAQEGSVVSMDALLTTISAGSSEKPENEKTLTIKEDRNNIETNIDTRSQDQNTDIENAPSAKKLMAENKISSDKIAGTGKGGRIMKDDVLKAVQSVAIEDTEKISTSRAPSSVEDADREERVKMTRLRQTIAKRLKDSQNTAAILTTYNEVDMTEVMSLRSEFKELFEKKHGTKLGFMSFFTKACCHALKEVPEVNAEIDATDIVYKNYVHMGIAAGTPTGLVVPVIRNADSMSFADIEKSIAEKGKRARDGKLSMDEMQGGTFTISNGGVYGSLMSSPILNPPQSGILGMHKIQDRPMALNGEVVIRPMMYLALSYDHRIVDGKGAVTFLVRVKEALEDPRRLLMDL
ncbi:2-oxoglutarate dehydrogenase complex dihydrolipoyllysine-residue succinyltransferase [Paracoccaceae bacterium]|nr:2-oxoglutarate dehydrogenase complex dihydrolipoyllysine-residue succinyltransferase [Paracoccaceae bacterium]